MKSLKFISAVVALALMFSACSKNVPDQLFDEDMNITVKGYEQLKPFEDPEQSIAFSWNSITASDFAKGVTPPFNNWAKPLGEGVVVFRVKPNGENTLRYGLKNLMAGQTGAAYLESMLSTEKQLFGNGNDPVLIWFDPVEIGKQLLKGEIGLDASMTVLVRYRASNNVAFNFNLAKACLYCLFRGPISLDCEAIGHPNLGEVTQVRLQPVETGSKRTEVKVCINDQYGVLIGCFDMSKEEGCPSLEKKDILDYFNIEELEALLTLSDNQSINHWVVVETGKTFDFPYEVCRNITLQPVIKTVVQACVEHVDDSCFPLPPGIGECPVLTWDYFVANFDFTKVNLNRQIIVGWMVITEEDGEVPFGEGVDVQSCGDIMLRPVLANFTGYEVVRHVNDCDANTLGAILYLVETYDDGSKGEKQFTASIRWGGTITDNRIKKFTMLEGNDNNLGCGGNYSYEFVLLVQNGDYADYIYAKVGVGGKWTTGNNMVILKFDGNYVIPE